MTELVGENLPTIDSVVWVWYKQLKCYWPCLVEYIDTEMSTASLNKMCNKSFQTRDKPNNLNFIKGECGISTTEIK